MIVWNEKFKKSEDVIKAVINELYKEQLNIDGVVEIFNNGKEQGTILKVFDKYNPNLDMCIWVYMHSDRKTNNEINITVGKHIDCNKINMWDNAELDSYIFKDAKAREMHNQTRDFIVETIIKNIEKTHDFSRI